MYPIWTPWWLVDYQGLCSIFDVSIRLFHFRHFRRELQSGMMNLRAISSRLGLRFRSDLLWFSLFYLGFLVRLAAIVWQSSCGIILVPWYPSENCSGVFGGTDSQWIEASLEVFSLPYGVVNTWWRRSHGEIFPSLWQYLFFYVFPLVLLRRMG